jgi:hypothetical protein
MNSTGPVFYDCEASSLEGLPIEIGWAFLNPQNGQIQSESHLIRPPANWDLLSVWDPEAEAFHHISIKQLMAEGRPPLEIACRMNLVLAGSELFSDDSKDEIWLRQMFDEAACDPAFMICKTNAGALTDQVAHERGWDAARYEAAKQEAVRAAPHIHRAEADARYWAVLWSILERNSE